MKLSKVENENALDLLADIIEPTAKILSDSEVVNTFKSGKKIEGVKIIIKNHKKEIMAILAALDGVPVEQYKCNILTLPVKILEILNDEELMEFFTSQA